MKHSLEPQWEVPIPEQATFRLTPAGPMIRMGAWLVDLSLQIAIVFCIFVLAAFIGDLRDGGVGIFLLLLFLIEWGWHVCWEGLRQGQTPGKKWLGIRVVDRDGRAPGIAKALLRNLLRVADWLPVAYGLGLLVMISDRGFRRLGDLAADTLVVRVEAEGTVAERVQKKTLPDEGLSERLPRGIAAYLPEKVTHALDLWATMRSRFGPIRREEIAAHLAGPIAVEVGLPQPQEADRFLCALINQQRQAGMGRDHARAAQLVAKRQRSQERLERLVKRGLGRLRAQEVLQLADHHRAACADLALTRAYAFGRNLERTLEDAIARVHLLLHHDPKRGWRQHVRHFAEAVFRGRAQLQRDPCWRFAAVGFFGPFLTMIPLVVARPELATEILGEPFIDQLEWMYADPLSGRSLAEDAGMMSYYIRNNVGIALSCFAIGVLAGVGSLVLLVWNGVILGTVFGHMVALGGPVRDHFLEFVTAHGPFELTGIAISGAAGLRMGWGTWQGNGLHMLSNLRRSAREALPLIAAGATLVAMAAPVEAFISPSSLPLWGKRLVGIVCLALVLVFLAWPGHRHAGRNAEGGLQHG